MENRRLPVRKIKEVLRLKYDCNLSDRQISRSCQVSWSAIADYIMKAKVAGLSWSEAAENVTGDDKHEKRGSS